MAKRLEVLLIVILHNRVASHLIASERRIITRAPSAIVSSRLRLADPMNWRDDSAASPVRDLANVHSPIRSFGIVLNRVDQLSPHVDGLSFVVDCCFYTFKIHVLKAVAARRLDGATSLLGRASSHSESVRLWR